MPAFHYRVRDKSGQPLSGIMGGDSTDAVSAKLKKMGYTPIAITPARERAWPGGLFYRFKAVRLAELNLFNRQFAALQRAGVPLLLSLEALKEQVSNKIFQDVIAQIIRDIKAGASLSAALSRHPRIFNAIYVNMIESAEASGTLDQTLERLSVLGEHEEKVRLRIKAATRYPLIVVVAITLAFFILVTLVVPRFAHLYNRFSTALPLPTRVLIGLNNLFTGYWWLLLALVMLFVIGFLKFIHTEKGRDCWDRLKLRFPVFGELMLKLTMSRFSRLSGTLMASGIPILQVLELTAGGAGNTAVSKVIDKIRFSVSEGKGLFEPMKQSGIFPPVVTQMVLVGEESGNLDELLLHISNYYDSQVDYMINNLIALLEPLLILVLGGMVLFMALGIFLPMWSIIRLFR